MELSTATSRALAWAGISASPDVDARLVRLAAWIADEAIPSGGVGPNEVTKIEDRHIADSLCFARAWVGHVVPATIIDLGAGVGLPAMPLAVTHPDSQVIAVDRSARRCQLIRRAARVLALDNLVALQADFTAVSLTGDAVVSRAAMPPESLLPHLIRLTQPDGSAVTGGSHVERPEVPGFETLEVPPEILDRSAWLLKMTRP